jgi:hypothetical protein
MLHGVCCEFSLIPNNGNHPAYGIAKPKGQHTIDDVDDNPAFTRLVLAIHRCMDIQIKIIMPILHIKEALYG